MHVILVADLFYYFFSGIPSECHTIRIRRSKNQQNLYPEMCSGRLTRKNKGSSIKNTNIKMHDALHYL